MNTGAEKAEIVVNYTRLAVTITRASALSMYLHYKPVSHTRHLLISWLEDGAALAQGLR